MTLWKDRTLALAAFCGLTAFLYQLSDILTHHSTWSDFRQPATVGEVVFAIVMGLTAVGASLGLDVPSLMRGFKQQPKEQD